MLEKHLPLEERRGRHCLVDAQRCRRTELYKIAMAQLQVLQVQILAMIGRPSARRTLLLNAPRWSPVPPAYCIMDVVEGLIEDALSIADLERYGDDPPILLLIDEQIVRGVRTMIVTYMMQVVEARDLLYRNEFCPTGDEHNDC